MTGEVKIMINHKMTRPVRIFTSTTEAEKKHTHRLISSTTTTSKQQQQQNHNRFKLRFVCRFISHEFICIFVFSKHYFLFLFSFWLFFVSRFLGWRIRFMAFLCFVDVVTEATSFSVELSPAATCTVRAGCFFLSSHEDSTSLLFRFFLKIYSSFFSCFAIAIHTPYTHEQNRQKYVFCTKHGNSYWALGACVHTAKCCVAWME